MLRAWLRLEGGRIYFPQPTFIYVARDPDAECRPARRFQSLESGGREATSVEKRLLWAFLPKFSQEKQEKRKLPRGSQRRCQGNKRAGRGHQPLGTGHGRRAHLAQGRHRDCSVLRALGRHAPGWCVCGGTKAAPVRGEWPGHLIGGPGPAFTPRERCTQATPRGPPSLSPPSDGASSSRPAGSPGAFSQPEFEFHHRPATAPRGPQGSRSGLTSQIGFPKTLAPPPGMKFISVTQRQTARPYTKALLVYINRPRAQPPSFLSRQQNRGPCRAGLPSYVGSMTLLSSHLL